jgi:glycoprotein endo-alpha-1,2-mannosidase
MRIQFKMFFLIITCILIQPVFPQEISHNVHAFYYPWYGNPETDGHWSHWDHPIIVKQGEGGNYTPPNNIGANYYPELGCYSTMDETTIENHMQQLTKAGIGVISTSWWGVETDTNKAVPLILNAAEKYGIQVNFHIEPYPNRNALNTKDSIEYIIGTYGASKAFFRDPRHGSKPMFYVYDSYLTPAKEWREVLAPDGKHTIRGTEYDSIVIGLYVKEHDNRFMDTGNFDGFYTYFATNKFTYGSTISNWQALEDYAKRSGKIFIPSVGPGYIDTRIRPWNSNNTRAREAGEYYNRMWQAAVDANPETISITSFNEWHEGTQIETSIPKTIEGFTYLDFSPLSPDGYLTLTKQWVKRYMQK